MSDQNKSNLQALGAGLLGFVAVLAVGGGALLVVNRQAKTSSRAVPAAAPIDLGSSLPALPAMTNSVQRERRAESPAPLVGADESEQSSPAGSAGASGSSGIAPASQSSAKPAAAKSSLEVTQHLDAKGSSTAVAKSDEKSDAKDAAKTPKIALKAQARHAAAKADPKTDAPDASAVASVHYGVTDRSELMGRAAGPVYNFQGANKGGGTAANGKMAGGSAGNGTADVNAKLAEIKKQLSGSNLPPDQRAALLKQLEDAGADIEAPAAK